MADLDLDSKSDLITSLRPPIIPRNSKTKKQIQAAVESGNLFPKNPKLCSKHECHLVHVKCNAHSVLHYPSDQSLSQGPLFYEHFDQHNHERPPQESVSMAAAKALAELDETHPNITPLQV